MVTVVRQGDTYYAQRGSYFDGNVKIDGNFVVPPRTHFWGRLSVSGSLELGARSTVALGITCGSAIIGSSSQIRGPVVAEGDVTILDKAVVQEVRAGGNVTLRSGVHVGDVTAGEALVIHGKIKSKKLIGKTVKLVGD